MLKRDYAARPVHHNDMLLDQTPLSPIFARELQIIRQHWKIVLLCIMLSGAAGIAVAFLLPPRYAALVQFNVDYRTMQLRQQDAVYSESAVTDGVVESEVEVLKSEPTALAVITQLKLTDDPEFVPAGTSWRNRLAMFSGLGFLRGEEASSASRTALHNFQKALSVHRIGLSHIVEVRFRSTDPAKAARIANTISNVYLLGQREARANYAKSASAWLRPRVQEAGPSTSVLARAEPPSYASGLSDKVIFCGFLLFGACSGIGLALMVEATNSRIRNRDDLVNAVPLSCYGVLPRIAAVGRPKFGIEFIEFIVKNRNTALLHVIHHCRLAVMSSHPGETVRTIGVTSCAQGSGKSLVAAQLAMLMVQSGEKVLLIDANPYNPSISRLLAPHAAGGLHQALKGDVPLLDCIFESNGLGILPITSTSYSSQSSLIWTPRMSRLIGEALAICEYDAIVFDLPSISPYADVRASAPLIDVFLLVVGHGEGTENIRENLREIDDVAQKISGTVLNDGVNL
ncbi:P-loop NTPase [Rhizobiales bacterium RZME27]|uniref:P-loop NTPase n=1 Tax=Endobacterium cereale TaxID=2663029 RepID=A0A6A8A465_9HYPH|nr:tyrosine-protein kinase domain-containing protein [Endobacterium cereale]MEB2848143.1 P-loop NTPase [Endobacterium cereale]MQY46132.1 P-loop NTPase [Endobacterium cereale]